MQSVDLGAYLAGVESRKAALGLRDTPERTEAMRNRGGNRTRQKREQLSRIKARAAAAGLAPLAAYY